MDTAVDAAVPDPSRVPVAREPITSVLIAALGGEGGGVLAGWLVQCARDAGLPVQATSVPGVAQRTGATSYYIEWQAAAVGAAPAGADVAGAAGGVVGR